MSHGTNHSKGVAILIPQNIEYEIQNTDIDPNGRYIILNGKFSGKNLTLMNYYAPTKSDATSQLQYLDILIPKISEYYENLVLGGDLNVNLNPSLDKKGGKTEKTSVYATRLLQVFEEFNLIDIWRICNPNKTRFTWRENTTYGIIQSRLDYFICPYNFMYELKENYIGNSIYTRTTTLSVLN
jgi:exonuclease III